LAGEPELDGLRARLAACAGLELSQDRRDVVVHGAFRENETLGNLRVLQSLGYKAEHLDLSRSEIGGVLLRRRPGASRQSSGPALAQPLGDDRRRRPRSEVQELI